MAYVIREDLLAPRKRKIISYTGPNPFAPYGALRDLLKLIFGLKGKDLFEEDFRWDTTKDPNPFFVIIKAEVKMDKLSKATVVVKMQGKHPTDPSKSGTNSIELAGGLQTSYQVGSIFERIFFMPFIYFYHLAFYNKRKRRYIVQMNRRIETLEARIREVLKIPVKTM